MTEATATSINPINYPFSCECTTCPLHKELGEKCGGKNSVGFGGYFCKNCMHLMSWNNELELYTDGTETSPLIRSIGL